jgi:hypothetical protein
MSELLDAAFAVVHDYPGGASSLAPRLGVNPATLSHEVANRPGSKLGLLTAAKITVMTGDLRMLNAFAAMAGCLVLPLPAHADAPAGAEAMHHLARLAKEFGDVARVFAESVADGNVSANELASLHREVGELVVTAQAAMAYAQAVHDAGVARRGGVAAGGAR